MILLPLLILEGVALEVFYGSHIDVVSRRLAGSVADELGFTIDLMQRFPGAENTAWILDLARTRFGLDITLDPRRQAGAEEAGQRVRSDGRRPARPRCSQTAASAVLHRLDVGRARRC